MIFSPPLQRGELLQRYKRFLADVRLESGDEIVAHCPNPGSMKTCAEPGWTAWVSPANNPKRKLQWTLEVIESPEALILVNTARPNAIVEEGIRKGAVAEISSHGNLRREVRYGTNSRIDILLEEEGKPDCYIEVKNVTLLHAEDTAAFPDSVTKRGTKHLQELVSMVESGHRAVLFFLVSRTDVNRMVPAAHIDPTYAETLRWAAEQGVEVLAYRAALSSSEITVGPRIPVDLSG